MLVARSEDKLQEVAKELSTKNGVKVKVIAKDLTQLSASKEIFDQVEQEELKVPIL